MSSRFRGLPTDEELIMRSLRDEVKCPFEATFFYLA
jgi:hypothetical protein